jgi:ribosomal protein S18 acetylase RimI-like enzyme
MDTYEITAISPDEASAFRDFRLGALRDAPQAFGSTYEAEATKALSFFQERLSTNIVLAARTNGTIVGTAALAANSGAREKHKGFIWGVFVAPRARGQGVANALLTTLLAHADQHYEQVILTVMADNLSALALYQRIGFEAYGREPRSLKDETGYSDEILMIRFAP